MATTKKAPARAEKRVDDLAAATAAAEALVGVLRDIKTKRMRLVKQIEGIATQPMHLHARIWYRDQRYAYVHTHPPGGKRDKSYIGTDAAKIKDAETAIERGKKFLQLKADLAELDAELFGLRGSIESERRRAHDAFTGQQRMPAHMPYGDRIKHLASAIASPGERR